MENLLLWSPILTTFFFIFFSIYLFAYFAIFRNWALKDRPEASSCLISLAHGTPAVLMATHAIVNTQSPQTFASPNTKSQNMVLEFSIAYFLMDLLHYIVFIPNDILFILHHLATIYVFVTCRYTVGHGALAILQLLILAEVTSACQNMWSLARFRKADVLAAAKLYEHLSAPFYAFYSVVRGFLGPLVVYKMGVFYLSGGADNLIPMWAWVSWMVVIVSAILVSILWVSNNWLNWHRETSHAEQTKLS